MTDPSIVAVRRYKDLEKAMKIVGLDGAPISTKAPDLEREYQLIQILLRLAEDLEQQARLLQSLATKLAANERVIKRLQNRIAALESAEEE